MPAIFDPTDPSYLDEKSVRDEFTRVATVCRDCRRCTDLCGVFPTLFDLLDPLADHDPGRLAPAQQDEVAAGCFQCGACVAGCPYGPDVDDLAVDVPRLVLRVAAMRRATGQTPIRERVGTWLLTRRGVVARLVRAAPGSFGRRLVAAVSDVAPARLLGAMVRPTFSARFARRTPFGDAGPTGVTVFPTCLVEYEAPEVGEALVRVYEHNGIACRATSAGCCGAPWLHAGDLDEFGRIARRNVGILADEIRRGGDVVVAQPACRRIITDDYATHVRGADAELVATRTVGAVEHLVRLHDSGVGRLDTDFPGEVPGLIACHVDGPAARAGGDDLVTLLELTGARVGPVARTAGTGVTWGWRKAHVDTSLALARRLSSELSNPVPDLVVGEDHRANTAILEQTGVLPSHPLEVIARAYGIADDPGGR